MSINVSTMASFMAPPMGTQAAFEMGRNTGPWAGANSAVRQGLEQWKAQQAAQQEQQNKLGLLQKEYDLKKSVFSGTTDPDAAGPITQKDPTTGKYFYKSTTIDSNGIPKVSWAPVSPNAPENLKQTYMNEEVWGPLLEGRGAEPQASPIPGIGVPAPAATPVAAAPVPQASGAKTLDRATAMKILQQAGGDKDKARQIAASQGYKF